ncbi:MAG: PAS domain S-box protein [Desulfosarcinaceae bacterium]|nr:PAS domain S-box protein [Desulfosarcinaceae bacterium]
MNRTIMLRKKVSDLEALLTVSERKADILTNLLKEAGSEYEQTLQKIQVSEANFRAIFENAPEAIYIIDIETRRFLDGNPYIQKWLGYTREELRRMRLEEILAPGADHVQENIRKAVDEGVVYVQERRFKKKNGTIVDAEVTGTIMDYEGQKRFMALIRDITERKQIEALSRYKELFESVSDAVFINDDRGHFLEVNDVACDCLGYSRAQFLELTLREVTSPQYHEVLKRMGQRIHKDHSYQFELSLISRRGLTIPFEFQGRLISYHTKTAFLSVARDMSVRKQLQETLIRTERLSAVGEMASGVAHNFNNLLQMIMAGAEAARSKLEAGNIRDCKAAIENIIAASRRGADVVRRIKDFTHLSPDTFDGGSIFDLQTLVAEAIELTKPLWRPPSAPGRYELQALSDGRCHIKGQSSELFEVLVNMIKNALEAMPSGGVLTIATYVVEETVYLKISDSGMGIPEAHFQRIFEPFFTTKGTRSSGLGLSSCYGIVKKNNGEIHVDSQLGEGTEFTISFPKAQPAQTLEDPYRHPDQRRAPIRFLLIDDEINILKAMEMFFENTEIDLATAQTAHDGIAAIQADGFDVILCDLSMNDMSGLEVGKWVLDYSHRNGMPKIPFLLYTGLDKHLDAAKLEEAGIDRVVNKPTPCQDIFRIVGEMANLHA